MFIKCFINLSFVERHFNCVQLRAVSRFGGNAFRYGVVVSSQASSRQPWYIGSATRLNGSC